MSPHSVEGAIGYSGLTDEPWPRAEISLCGGLGTDEFSPMLFEQSRISFDDFVNRIEDGQRLAILLTSHSVDIPEGSGSHILVFYHCL